MCVIMSLIAWWFVAVNIRMKAKHINHLLLAATIRTARYNIKQFYVLSTQCIYVFCVDLRTNSHYFPIQH